MQTVKELESTNAVKNSMKSIPAALDYLALVVVQDALEDAERYPENPVHALLLGSPLFTRFSCLCMTLPQCRAQRVKIAACAKRARSLKLCGLEAWT